MNLFEQNTTSNNVIDTLYEQCRPDTLSLSI